MKMLPGPEGCIVEVWGPHFNTRVYCQFNWMPLIAMNWYLYSSQKLSRYREINRRLRTISCEFGLAWGRFCNDFKHSVKKAAGRFNKLVGVKIGYMLKGMDKDEPRKKMEGVHDAMNPITRLSIYFDMLRISKHLLRRDFKWDCFQVVFSVSNKLVTL